MRFVSYLVLSTLAAAAPPPRVFTIAGTGVPGYNGDHGLATDAQLNNPYGLVIGPDSALYICEIDNHVVRRYDLKTKELTTVAGNARQGYSGDGGLATDASMNQPYEVRFDRDGNMYVVEMQNHVVRRIEARTHRISTVAGNGTPGFSGDGGPATKAQLRQPHSIAFDPLGRMLICDIGNHRIRRVDLKSGMIETFAGNGERKPTPDGAPIEGTPLNGPRAIDLDRQGNIWLVLREGNAVYKIDAKLNRIFLIAGTGQKGYAGDGGPALRALLSGPKAISHYDSNLYIADTESHSIRKINLGTGIISTLVGTGDRGDGPDGDPLKCRLARPHGVYVDPKGTVYIADSENHRVREIKEPPPLLPVTTPVRQPGVRPPTTQAAAGSAPVGSAAIPRPKRPASAVIRHVN